MMIPVPSPVSRRLWATMSTTDGSTLARMPFTSRAAPASGAADPEPAGPVVAEDEPDGEGIGGGGAPPGGAGGGGTAGGAEAGFGGRLPPVAAPGGPGPRGG